MLGLALVLPFGILGASFQSSTIPHVPVKLFGRYGLNHNKLTSNEHQKNDFSGPYPFIF